MSRMRFGDGEDGMEQAAMRFLRWPLLGMVLVGAREGLGFSEDGKWRFGHVFHSDRLYNHLENRRIYADCNATSGALTFLYRRGVQIGSEFYSDGFSPADTIDVQ